MAEKEWSEDPEDDPIELQKKQLALGKKFLEKMEKQEAEEKARKEAYAQEAIQPHAYVTQYTPPTFEEVSATLKKAWSEVEHIMPNAPDAAKSYAFQTLVHSLAKPMTGIGSYVS